MENEKFSLVDKLTLKANAVKKGFDEVFNIRDNHKYSNYDYFKLKNIIKENLTDLQKKTPSMSLLNNEKYADLLNEDSSDIKSYLDQNKIQINQNIEYENKSKKSLKESINSNIEEINRLEINAIHKAKELENQINYINDKRIDFIVKEFKEKLVEDSQTEFKNFLDILHEEYKSALTKINEENSSKLNSISKLQNKIDELQNMLKTVNEELRDEKIELSSSFDKYLSHMEKEKNLSIEKYKVDMNNFVENRVKIFRKHLDSNK